MDEKYEWLWKNLRQHSQTVVDRRGKNSYHAINLDAIIHTAIINLMDYFETQEEVLRMLDDE